MGTRKQATGTCPIEQANRKPDAEFVRSFLEPGAPNAAPWTTTWTHPGSQHAYTLALKRAGQLTQEELNACFGLVEQTSRSDYEGSTAGWKPKAKRTEMQDDDLRYICVTDADSVLCGFTSLMPTYEADQPVVYCYEIHLQPELLGTGLGRMLLGYQETVAYNLPPICKVMLTCFISNQRAMGFYRKMSYDVDDISPGPRHLRGKTVVPDYAIMSKTVICRGSIAPV